MPENKSRKYITRVDYIADFPGADIPRDMLKVALASQDTNATPLSVKDENLQPIQQDSDGAVYIVLKTDDVGLLKDSKIPVALQQDSGGAVNVVLKTDNVGLAKSTDITELKTVNEGIKTQTDKLQFDSRNLLKIYTTDDKLQVMDRTTTTHEFIPSGIEVAFNEYKIGTGLVTRNDGLLRCNYLSGDGVITGSGIVSNFS